MSNCFCLAFDWKTHLGSALDTSISPCITWTLLLLLSYQQCLRNPTSQSLKSLLCFFIKLCILWFTHFVIHSLILHMLLQYCYDYFDNWVVFIVVKWRWWMNYLRGFIWLLQWRLFVLVLKANMHPFTIYDIIIKKNWITHLKISLISNTMLNWWANIKI